MSSSSDDEIKVQQGPELDAKAEIGAAGPKVKKKLDPEVGIDKKSYRNLVIASLFIPLVGWFVGLTNGFAGKRLAKQAWTLFAVSTVSFIVLVALFGGDGTSSDDRKLIDWVRNGEMSEFPGKTVGQAAEAFFGDPKWHLVFNDGKFYVDVTGKLTYMDKVVEAKLQFALHTLKGFDLFALEFNEVAQPKAIMLALIQKMFSGN